MVLIEACKSALAAVAPNTLVRLELGPGGSVFQIPAAELMVALGVEPATHNSPDPAILTLVIPTKKVRVTSPILRIRAAPTTSATILETLNQDAVIEVIDAAQVSAENFNWVRTADGRGWLAIDYTVSADTPETLLPETPVWPLPMSAAQRGVGTSAGGWAPSPTELDLIQRNGIEFALIVAYEPGQAAKAVPALRSAGIKQFVLRAATHETPSADPRHFIDRTVPVLREYVSALGSLQPVLIAVHNEPNLVKEGWTTAWRNGTDFATWYLAVLAAYRQAFAGAKIGFPAMSPGADVPGIRMNEAAFTTMAAAAIRESDWIGVHYYWADPDGADINPPLAQWRTWFGQKGIIGTEIGPTDQNRITPGAMRVAFEKFAAIGIPATGWVLSGAGAWQNAAWDLHNIQL